MIFVEIYVKYVSRYSFYMEVQKSWFFHLIILEMKILVIKTDLCSKERLLHISRCNLQTENWFKTAKRLATRMSRLSITFEFP